MRVERLYRYPVKGLSAEALEEVELTAGECLPQDRRFALVQGDAPFEEAAPRFLPKPARWRDADELTIRPAFFVRTLRDGLVFLAAIPVMEGIEHLQSSGLIGFPVSLF